MKKFYGSVKNKAAVAGALSLGLVTSAQAVVDTAPILTGITDAQTAILVIVAAGGGAMIAIALGKVAWTAGAKFISRLGSKA